jgi:histidinol-phosphate aminotransferase
LAGVSPYEVPPLGPPVDLRLDGNEGAVPPAELLDELRKLGSDVMRRYPSARPLEELLACRFGVDPERVLVTAGADEALDRACRAMLAPGREIVLPTPTFEMLPRYARLAGGEVVTVPWPAGPYPTNEVLRAVSERAAIIAVVSPNNPTGAVASAEDIERLSRAAPHALVLADLAYVEFADEDPTALVLSLPNVLVVSTLSKAWGLAGLRVGYAVGPPEVLGWLRAAAGPYAVSRPSLALAAARLETGQGEVDAFVETVRRERGELERLLTELGAEPSPSQGNFAFARFRDAAWVRDALAGLGIAVRSFPDHPDLEGCVRITCPGDAASFARLTAALRTILKPEGLIIDRGVWEWHNRIACRLVDRFDIAILDEDNRLDSIGAVEAGEPERIADPAETVRAGLGEIGGKPAWLVTWSPDEVRAARAAGVLPLGFLAPGMTPQNAGRRLTEAGAARVLTDLRQLEELLR